MGKAKLFIISTIYLRMNDIDPTYLMSSLSSNNTNDLMLTVYKGV